MFLDPLLVQVNFDMLTVLLLTDAWARVVLLYLLFVERPHVVHPGEPFLSLFVSPHRY